MTTVFVVTEDEADFGQLILGVTSTLEAAAALAEADTRTPLEWRLPGRGAPGFYARVSP